jgi:hypothetical protein
MHRRLTVPIGELNRERVAERGVEAQFHREDIEDRSGREAQ